MSDDRTPPEHVNDRPIVNLPKSPHSRRVDTNPGTWWRTRTVLADEKVLICVLMRCPDCARVFTISTSHPDNHFFGRLVQPDGMVASSLFCPGGDCAWRSRAKLLDWTDQ